MNYRIKNIIPAGRFLLFLIPLALLLSMAAGPSSLADWKAPVSDTLRIGRQVWMKQNVSIPIQNSFWYERDSLGNIANGRLYFFSSAMRACPKGWHLPSDAEWQELIDQFGGDSKAAEALLQGGASGLNLTLAGYRSGNSSNDLFGKKGEQGFYWTSTVKGEQTAYARGFTAGSTTVSDQYYRRANAFSVRYVKDY
jgi:uncharacterized protein (TIGR02145 family)